MSAYDNPTIVKDVYGSEGWANMAKQIAGVTVGVTAAIGKERTLQRKVAADEDQLYQESYASAQINQEAKAEARYDAYEKGGASKPFVTQKQELTEYQMYGGIHTYNGVEKDYGIGSIAAAAKIAANIDISPAQRKEYLGIVNAQQKRMDGFAGEAALSLTDKDVFIKGATIVGSKSHYLEGVGEANKYSNLLAGSSLYDLPLPKGFKQTKRDYEEIIVDGEPQSILKMEFQIKANSPLAKAYLNNPEYKPDEDGMITIGWERNLTDGSWDGNLMNEQELERVDLSEDVKKYMDNGELNKQFQVVLPANVNEGSGAEQGQQVVMTWANVSGVEKGLKTKLRAHSDGAADLYLQKPQAGNAYLRSKLGRAGIDYQKEIASGNITEEQLRDKFYEYEVEAMKTKFGIGQEWDAESGTYVDQDVNGLKLQRRPITQKQIDYLKENKVDGWEELKEGDMQYFYMDTSVVKNKEEKAKGKGLSKISAVGSVYDNYNLDLAGTADRFTGRNDAVVKGNIVSGTEEYYINNKETGTRPYEYDLSKGDQAWDFYKSAYEDEGRFKGTSERATKERRELEKMVREDARLRSKNQKASQPRSGNWWSPF